MHHKEGRAFGSSRTFFVLVGVVTAFICHPVQGKQALFAIVYTTILYLLKRGLVSSDRLHLLTNRI